MVRAPGGGVTGKEVRIISYVQHAVCSRRIYVVVLVYVSFRMDVHLCARVRRVTSGGSKMFEALVGTSLGPKFYPLSLHTHTCIYIYICI